MHVELEVLKLVSERLDAVRVPYMLTGSFAMAYYGQPRMTRDIDLVVALVVDDITAIVLALSPDFYIDGDEARSAVESQRLFNVMHHATGVKVDLIVRKGSEYRQVEFARRRDIEMSGIRTCIVSQEDLILSKLVWAREANSELQRRDVAVLLDESVDRKYLDQWATRLGVAEILAVVSR